MLFALWLLSQTLGFGLPALSSVAEPEMPTCPPFEQRQAENATVVYDGRFLSRLVYDAESPPATTQALSEPAGTVPTIPAYGTCPISTIQFAAAPRAPPIAEAGFVAAKTTAPRFLVTESGVAVPTSAAELKANMQLLQEASTKPATARKFLGTDSQGPLRVRIEQAHPSTPGYTGPIDPLHTVDHLHIDRRLNGTTGPWQSSEKLPYDWPF